MRTANDHLLPDWGPPPVPSSGASGPAPASRGWGFFSTEPQAVGASALHLSSARSSAVADRFFQLSPINFGSLCGADGLSVQSGRV